jgi:ABC-type polysaccharide/polyol phosphate transport system ATPase subunit
MALIKLDDVTVAYPVGMSEQQRSAFASAARALSFGVLGVRGSSEFVVALNGVSLTIPSGARIGLVGRNGSGKSTLLRTMAGIIPPTYGTRTIDGSIGCVLTMGSGMNVERTGIQNLRTLARILGFRGSAVDELVQDAADFAELGPFVHLPVRTYSSGMLARLCFAAATAQRAEILLIDEVIATGDLHFAQKAVARVKRICATSGIVVVATHAYEVLSGFCTHAIWMDKGRVRASGRVDEIWQMYSDASQVEEHLRVAS